MMNLDNISSLANIWCSFSLHENQVALEFLWRSWVSAIFDLWATSDVGFRFMKTRSFQNLSHHDEFQQYFIIGKCGMFFPCSSKWNQFRISLKMTNFRNIWWLTEVPCFVSLHQDESILEFRWEWCIATIFDHWPAAKVFFSSLKWDHFRICLIMMNFNNVWSLTKAGCSFCLHQEEIILEYVSRGWISTMFYDWATSDVLFLLMRGRSV